MNYKIIENIEISNSKKEYIVSEDVYMILKNIEKRQLEYIKQNNMPSKEQVYKEYKENLEKQWKNKEIDEATYNYCKEVQPWQMITKDGTIFSNRTIFKTNDPIDNPVYNKTTKSGYKIYNEDIPSYISINKNKKSIYEEDIVLFTKYNNNFYVNDGAYPSTLLYIFDLLYIHECDAEGLFTFSNGQITIDDIKNIANCYSGHGIIEEVNLSIPKGEI